MQRQGEERRESSEALAVGVRTRQRGQLRPFVLQLQTLSSSELLALAWRGVEMHSLY